MWCSHETVLKINQLEARGVPVRERLKISSACPLICLYVALDQAREAKRGEKKLGQLAVARPTRMGYDADFALVI